MKFQLYFRVPEGGSSAKLLTRNRSEWKKNIVEFCLNFKPYHDFKTFFFRWHLQVHSFSISMRSKPRRKCKNSLFSTFSFKFKIPGKWVTNLISIWHLFSPGMLLKVKALIVLGYWFQGIFKLGVEAGIVAWLCPLPIPFTRTVDIYVCLRPDTNLIHDWPILIQTLTSTAAKLESQHQKHLKNSFESRKTKWTAGQVLIILGHGSIGLGRHYSIWISCSRVYF